MSDKKDTAAALGYSEELSVQHSPRERIPAVFQQPEEGAKGSAPVLRQYSGDVLPENPSGLNLSNSPRVFEHEATTRVIQALAPPRDAERLARASADDEVALSTICTPIHPANVAEVRNAGETLLQQLAAERIDLRKGDGLPSHRCPCDARRLDSAEQAYVLHDAPPLHSATGLCGMPSCSQMPRSQRAPFEPKTPGSSATPSYRGLPR